MTRAALDWRGAPTVPLVLQPPHDDLPGPPTLGAGCICAIDRARAVLTAFDGRLADRAPRRTLADAAGALREVVAHLAHRLRDPAGVEGEPAPHDRYMGIRRAQLTAEQCAAEIAVVAHRAIVDLRDVPIHDEDVLAEVRAVDALLHRMTCGAAAADGDVPPGLRSAGRSTYTPSGDALERWVFAHHLYGIVLLHGAVALDAARSAAAGGADAVAANELRTAAVYARGATAVMHHAAATSGDHYRTHIRPSMHPPATPMDLGGSMNPENARYRAALRRLLKAIPGPYAALAARSPELAAARDAFLETDLLDIERHVAVAALLVEDARSTLQAADSQDNAVSALRRMHLERVRAYGPLLRHAVGLDPEPAHPA